MAELHSSDDSTQEPAWLVTEVPSRLRWATMFRTAWKMAIHDRQQTIAAILGVAFAYVLIGENLSASGHYVDQSSSYVDATEADLWLVPPGEKAFMIAGSLVPLSALHQAQVTPGVEWAAPVVRGFAGIKTPDGGVEQVIVVGAQGPLLRGGPFSLVKGVNTAILSPNAIIVEDANREKHGGLNIGTMVELGGHRAHVEGLTWGLMTTFGSYAFAEYDFARSILEIDSDRCSVVLVRLDGTVGIERVRAELRERVPDALVLTSEEYRKRSHDFILYDGGLIGIVFLGVLTGLTVGMAIVTLAMLSAVQQNLREFGVLKAIGATNSDLRRLLLVHAVLCSVVGSFVGAAALCQLAWVARTPRLIMMLPPAMLVALVPTMAFIAVASALLAIRRINRVEPASVFR